MKIYGKVVWYLDSLSIELNQNVCITIIIMAQRTLGKFV